MRKGGVEREMEKKFIDDEILNTLYYAILYSTYPTSLET